MTRKKREMQFLSEVATSWRSAGGHWYKIPDVGGRLMRFALKRPYDVHASFHGKFYVVEGKFTSARLLRINEIEPHQLDSLREAARHGYRAFVLVGYEWDGRRTAHWFSIATIDLLRQRKHKHLLHEFRDGVLTRGAGGVWSVNHLNLELAARRAEDPLRCVEIENRLINKRGEV